MRISAPSVKAGILVVAVVLVPMIGIVLLEVDAGLGFAGTTFAIVALVVFTARVFRGETESSAPRPWWQLSASRASSVVLAVVFLGQASFAFFGSWAPLLVNPAKVSAVAFLMVGVAYAYSAMRLSRLEAEAH
nr:hypothetical protein [Microbacterium hydrocarbonoxydans]